MRRVNMVLSALLISSMIGGPAIAAESGTTQKPQTEQKKRAQTLRRPNTQNQKQGDSGGLDVHHAKRKSSGSSNSSNWLSAKQGHHDWSF